MSEIPDSLKNHNWNLYEQAMSADPSIACQYVGKLLISLKVTMDISKIDEYNEIIDHEMIGARRAWFEYTHLGNPGRAMQTTSVILSKIGFLLYDKRFATAQARAFTGRQ